MPVRVNGRDTTTVNSIIPSKLPAQNIAKYASDSKKDCVAVTASTIRLPVLAAPCIIPTHKAPNGFFGCL